MRREIAVIGAGSWGTALAIHVANKFPVRLWSHNREHIAEMQKLRLNERFLPEIPFPDTIALFDDFEEAMSGATDILIAVPSTAFSEIVNKLKEIHFTTLPAGDLRDKRA
ncbi:NAD(P)-binding domain-containing protein [Ignatzschineria indica]|uniref:NAD(P)-binding domain-containing protein n=1 Tax=Ignatzschineria indica TaxID=472583 RepID=UPI0036376737